MKRLLALLLVLVLWILPAHAAVAFDATSSGHSATSTNTLTFSHTVGAGSNLGLSVCLSYYLGITADITGVTYGGVAMALVTGTKFNHVNPPDAMRSECWVLAAPATGANNVVISSSANWAELHAGAISATGVDQATPSGGGNAAGGSSTAPSVTITNATGDLVVDCIDYGGTFDATPGAGQTQRWDITGTVQIHGAGSSEAGAASTVMSWTTGSSGDWVISGFALKAAAAADATKRLSTLGVGN